MCLQCGVLAALVLLATGRAPAADDPPTPIERLKANLDDFRMNLIFLGRQDWTDPYRSVTLRVPTIKPNIPPVPVKPVVMISKAQAARIVDRLERLGLLAGQGEPENSTRAVLGPAYFLRIALRNQPTPYVYRRVLDWDMETYRRLQDLRKILDGEAAKAMDKLLKRLAPHRQAWRAAAQGTSAGKKPLPAPKRPSVAELTRSLKDPDPLSRLVAARWLAEIGPAAAPATGTLIEALKDSDPDVRRHAAVALRHVGPPTKSGIVGLVELLSDENMEVWHTVAEVVTAVVWSSGKGVDVLITALEDRSIRKRLLAARILGDVGPLAVAARPALLKATKDQDKLVRDSAAQSLRWIGPDAAHPLMVRYQGWAITDTMSALADDLALIAPKFPELARYRKDKAHQGTKRGVSVTYQYNFTRPTTKRGVRASDFGKNGVHIIFSCGPAPAGAGVVHAMSPPTRRLKHLRLYLWADVKTGANPSANLVKEVRAILDRRTRELAAIDRKHARPWLAPVGMIATLGQDRTVTIKRCAMGSRHVPLGPKTRGILLDALAAPSTRVFHEMPLISMSYGDFRVDGEVFEWSGSEITKMWGKNWPMYWRNWTCRRLSPLFHRLIEIRDPSNEQIRAVLQQFERDLGSEQPRGRASSVLTLNPQLYTDAEALRFQQKLAELRKDALALTSWSELLKSLGISSARMKVVSGSVGAANEWTYWQISPHYCLVIKTRIVNLIPNWKPDDPVRLESAVIIKRQ